MDAKKSTKIISLAGESIEKKRNDIKTYLRDVCNREEALYACLDSEKSFYIIADPLRHPLIFYYGHTAVFYVNKLRTGKLLEHRVEPSIESMLAVGVDEMSWDDLDTKSYSWPTVATIREYRKKVFGIVEDLIDSVDFRLPISWESPMWIILMGIEHQNVHIETSSVLVRQLPLGEVNADLRSWPICTSTGCAPTNRLLPVEGLAVFLGRSPHDITFGWDNEYGIYEEVVKPFKAGEYLVSNEEFLEFIQSDGYSNEEFWTEEGWRWKNFVNAEHPRFWSRKPGKDGCWNLRLMLQEVPMPWNWPVECNWLEAKAFCKWKSQQLGISLRLPSEGEWYILRQNNPNDLLDWTGAPGNINLEHFASPCPVDKFQMGKFYDVIGNVWQWTDKEFCGYPGFQVHPIYDDFSVPTFDGRHNIIKGGSWISCGNLAIKDSRYSFRRHFYQHAGFRYIQSDDHVRNEVTSPYMSDKEVNTYLEMHFGAAYFGIPNYPEQCVTTVMKYFENTGKDGQKVALEMGCAVGRAAFELAKYFDHVEAVDFSTRFIQCAVSLQNKPVLPYTIPIEGDIVEYKEVDLRKLGLDVVARKVHFKQADACNLRVDGITKYDLILACNLVDRLSEPKKFLQSTGQLLNQGGLLALTSPYTWLEEYTPKKRWIGGYRKDAEIYTTLEGLKDELSHDFDLIASNIDIPFVIRETKRKYQHTLADLSIWRKK